VSRLAVAESSGDPPKRYERAAGQAAGPVSNRTIRQSAASEPSGSTLGPSQSIHTPKRRERAVGKLLGPSQTEPSAETPRASRRAVRRARLNPSIRRSAASEPSGSTTGPSRPNHQPKRRERAVGQYARPVSTEPSAEAIRASRRASCRARLVPNHSPKPYERAARQAAGPILIHPPKRCTQAVWHASGHAPTHRRCNPLCEHATECASQRVVPLSNRTP